MNWGRAKTILIIMFLTVDAFLLMVLLQTRMGFVRLPEEAVQATVRVLQNNDVTIQENVIPRQRAKNQNIIMRNYFENPDKAARTMLGSFETVLFNETDHEYRYRSENTELYIKNTALVYKNNKPAALYSEKEAGEREALKKKLSERLAALGFKEKETCLEGLEVKNGLCICRAVPLYQGIKVYGISMYIEADSEAILKIEGNWFRAEKAELYEQEQLLDMTAVLSGLIYQDEVCPKEITKLEHAFYISEEYLSSLEIAAVPVYVITDGSGQERCFDARVGSLIE